MLWPPISLYLNPILNMWNISLWDRYICFWAAIFVENRVMCWNSDNIIATLLHKFGQHYCRRNSETKQIQWVNFWYPPIWIMMDTVITNNNTSKILHQILQFSIKLVEMKNFFLPKYFRIRTMISSASSTVQHIFTFFNLHTELCATVEMCHFQ